MTVGPAPPHPTPAKQYGKCEVYVYRSASVSVSEYLATFPDTWINELNPKTKQDCAVID
jgi:hypothetical protein